MTRRGLVRGQIRPNGRIFELAVFFPRVDDNLLTFFQSSSHLRKFARDLTERDFATLQAVFMNDEAKLVAVLESYGVGRNRQDMFDSRESDLNLGGHARPESFRYVFQLHDALEIPYVATIVQGGHRGDLGHVSFDPAVTQSFDLDRRPHPRINLIDDRLVQHRNDFHVVQVG